MMLYSYTERLALTGFLNALLNEWKEYEKNKQEITITSSEGTLVLSLLHDSLVQRFSFKWPAKISDQGREKDIGFQQVVVFICNHPSIQNSYSQHQINAFKEQVFASEQHMADVMTHRKSKTSIDGFIAAEQSLIGGHNLHPASKAHQGWSQQQAQQFSPDYAGEFALHWYFVKKELITGESAYTQDINPEDSLCELLLQSYQDADIKLPVPVGFVPYPVHPQQAEVLANNVTIQQYFDEGSIVDLNKQGRTWRATSSTRALWQSESRWMLKFSLAVKLTNSIRHLSPIELSRGVLFQQVSNELAGAEFKQRFPQFNVLQEPAWCGLRSVSGELLLDSLFCWRENRYLTGKETTVTLAAMTQESQDGKNSIVNLVSELAEDRNISTSIASKMWFEHFLENVIKPVAVARSDYGLVLLAHQQNLLVTLAGHLPVGGAFRDCQGTGYTDTALKRFPLLAANPPAYFVESEAVNEYFSYYLILNSLNSVVAALSTQLSDDDSQGLLRISQQFFSQLSQHSFYDRSFYSYLLTSEKLKIKGNFFCFLGIDNETELKDPSKIYQGINNPYRLLKDEKTRLTYKPILFNVEDPAEQKTGLNLIFKQSGKQLIIESNWQQWRLEWHVSGEGCHQLCKPNEIQSQMSPYSEAVSVGLVTDSKMSPKQWFNVLEYYFSGLISPTIEEKQSLNQCIFIDQQVWEDLTDVEVPSWANVLSGQVILKRNHFFQFAGIWTDSQSSSLSEITDEQFIEADNGSYHPIRPAQPEGVWYQRYIYPLQRVISFKCIDVDQDLTIFNDWHNTPNISRMWELAGDLKMHRDYINKQTNDDHTMAVVGYFDGVPFGYFEVYWAAEDRLGPYYDYQPYDRGVHMLVGNKLFLGHRNFVNWASAILHACFVDENKTLHIMGEPRADNHHVVRITKNIGMVKLKEFDFPHKRSALMCCERTRFFNSFI